MSPDRAKLHRKNDVTIQDPLPARWNGWLFDSLVPPTWTRLLLYLAQTYPDCSAYQAWPRDVHDITNEFHGITNKVLNIIEKEGLHVWYTPCGYTCSTLGLLGGAGDSKAQRKAFGDAKVPVIYPPKRLRLSIESACTTVDLSAQTLCKYLEGRQNVLRALDHHTKGILLEYIVASPTFEDYGTVEIFPFEDGEYKAVRENHGFLHRNDAERELFALEGHLNIDLDKISRKTRDMLQRRCSASSNGWLRNRSIRDLIAYCQATYFASFRPGQDVIELDGDAEQFVSRVWNWIGDKNQSLVDTELSPLWLVPLKCGGYRRIRPQHSPCAVMYAAPGDVGDYIRRMTTQNKDSNRYVLSTDRLPFHFLQLLLSAGRHDDMIFIKNCESIEDFVVWMSTIPTSARFPTPDDRIRLQELITHRIHPRNSAAIVRAVRRLEIFKAAVTKPTDEQTYVPRNPRDASLL